MMAAIGLGAGYAMLIWWFTTGIILYLDGKPRSTFRWSMGGATLLLAIAIHFLRVSTADAGTGGAALIAFSCSIVIWGWLEMSFLMGFITGPRKHACHEKCGGWQHFLHGVEVLIYSELATLAAALLVYLETWQAPNRVAWWTFAVLWSMRLSAKLNLFFGVPNTGEQFLPPHLHYLRSFFRKRRMNFLFPLSVTAATIVDATLVQKCLAAEDAFQTTAFALISCLLALAVLEHWFMILPLPTEKLWSWGFRGVDSAPVEATRIVAKAP